MEYRALGTSGIAVSAISLGCWAFGGGGWGEQDESQAIATVHEAIDMDADGAPF